MLNNYLNPQFQRGNGFSSPYAGNTMTTMPVGTPATPQKSMSFPGYGVPAQGRQPQGQPWQTPQPPAWQQPQPWGQNAWQTPNQQQPGNMYAFAQPAQWSPWAGNGLAGYLSAYRGGWG